MTTNNNNANNVNNVNIQEAIKNASKNAAILSKSGCILTKDPEILLLWWDEKLREGGFNPCLGCNHDGDCPERDCKYFSVFQERMTPVDDIKNIQFIAGRPVIHQSVCGYYGKAPEWLDKILRRLY